MPKVKVKDTGIRDKKEHDFAINAFRVVQEATGQVVPAPKTLIDYKALGRKGGLNGGRVRAERLSPERRTEIAKTAALARWGSKR